MALTSMTGFADLAGSGGGASWTWEARSVNGRGLDVRVKLPEGCETLDAAIRAAAARVLARGSVTVTLRRARGGSAALPRLSPGALEAAVAAALTASEVAAGRGLALAPITAADLLAVRGVLETDAAAPGEEAERLAAMAAGIEPLFAGLAAARAAEGTALVAILAGQIDRIEALTRAARSSAGAREGRTAEALRGRIETLLATLPVPVDEARLAQELALLAVRADVTEELDRLEAHIAAARALVAGEGPVGRKLDFLMQEFNREANTLCSKAQASELTAVGLELKVVIDQMREQVQNVE
ncbi:YicC/YloC family endoribonuclease [Amaricoccus sp.]|uniref:YicC/YloC family endoribonuclease n=1 Tax=Amaricoccus sp. TaxID=1872485 RepID=UPI00262FC5E2|nr:YicC/YloC family endoribonuclease [Amaricoccus sp.]HRO10426.1 YicC family protein [Amaricoccus sp.]